MYISEIRLFGPIRYSLITMLEKLLDVLDSIRRKPESTRWAIVAAITALVAVLSIVLWGWNLSRQFDRLARPPEAKRASSALLNPINAAQKTWEALRQGNSAVLTAEETAPEELPEAPPEANAGTLTAKIQSGLAVVGAATRFNIHLVAEMFRDLTR